MRYVSVRLVGQGGLRKVLEGRGRVRKGWLRLGLGGQGRVRGVEFGSGLVRRGGQGGLRLVAASLGGVALDGVSRVGQGRLVTSSQGLDRLGL